MSSGLNQNAATGAPASNWKPYPAYKDSGVEWLGKVPGHWEILKLKYTDKVIMGQSPSSEDYNDTHSGLPFLQGNAEFGNINPNPKIWCEKANKTASIGDILYPLHKPW
jgi:type I restriction enzyme S subunit